MGKYTVDSHEKGNQAICLQNVVTGRNRKVETMLEEKALPALEQFQEVLDEVGNKSSPTKVTITIHGTETRSFSIEIENLSEIQEILQWTVCKE